MSHPVLKDLASNVEFELDKGKLLKVVAAKGSKFAIIDKETGLPVKDVDLKVQGDDLLIESKDGEIMVLIEDFALAGDGDPRSVFVTTLENTKQMTEVTVALTAEHIAKLAGEGETLTLSANNGDSKDDHDNMIAALYTWGAVIMMGTAFFMMNNGRGSSTKGKFNFVDDYYPDDNDPGTGVNPGPGGKPGPGGNPNTPATNTDGEVAISRMASKKGVLVAKVTDEDGIDGAIEYQWMKNGDPIQGATGESYNITSNDVGAKISVKVTYKDNKGKVENHESNSITPDANDLPSTPIQGGDEIAINEVAGSDGVLDSNELNNTGLGISGSTNMSKRDIEDKNPSITIGGIKLNEDDYSLSATDNPNKDNTWTVKIKPAVLKGIINQNNHKAGDEIEVKIELDGLKPVDSKFTLDDDIFGVAPTPSTPDTFELGKIAVDNAIDATEFGAGITVTGSTNMSKADILKLKPVLHVGGKAVSWDAFKDLTVANDLWAIKLKPADLKALKDAGQLVDKADNEFDVVFGNGDLDPKAVKVSLNLGQVPPTPSTPDSFELGKIAVDNAIDATEFGAGITVTGSTNMSKAEILKLKPVLHVGGKAVAWDAFKDLTVANDIWAIKLKPADLKALKDAGQLVDKADNEFDVVFGDGDLDPKAVNVSLNLGQVPPTPSKPNTFELGKIAVDNAIDATEFGAGITVTGSTNMSKADILKLKPVLHVGGKAVSWDAFKDLTVANDTWAIKLKPADLQSLKNSKQLIDQADNEFDVVFGDGDLDPKAVNVSLDLGQVPPTPSTPKTFELGKIAVDNAIDATEFGAGITVTGSTNMSKADILKLKPVLHVGGKAVAWDAFKDLTVANDTWAIKLNPADLQSLKNSKQLIDKADNEFDVVFGNGDLDPKAVNVSLDLGQVPPTPSKPNTFEIGKIAVDNAIDATEFGAGITVTGSTNMSKADILKLKPVLHVGGKAVSWDAFKDLTVANDIWSIKLKPTDLQALKNAKQLVDQTENEFDVVFGDGDLDPKAVNVSLNLGQVPPTPTTPKTFELGKIAVDNAIDATEFGAGITVTGSTNMSKADILKLKPVLHVGGKAVSWDAFKDLTVANDTWAIKLNPADLQSLKNSKQLIDKADNEFDVVFGDGDLDPKAVNVSLNLGQVPPTPSTPKTFELGKIAVDNAIDATEFGAGITVTGSTNMSKADILKLKPVLHVGGKAVSWDAFKDLTVANDTWAIKLKPTDLQALKNAKQLVDQADNEFDVVFGDGDLDPKAVNVSLNLGQVPPTPTTPKTFELGKIAVDNAIDATEFGAGITVTGSTNMSKADILKLKPVLHVGGKEVSWDAFKDLTVANDIWSIKLKPTDLQALKDAKQLVDQAENEFDVVFGDGDLDPKAVNVSLNLGQVPPTPTTPKTFELGKIAVDNAIDATEFGAGITVTGSTNMSKADILKLKPVLHVGGKEVSWDAFKDLTVANDTWAIKLTPADLQSLKNSKQLIDKADNEFDVVFGDGDLDPKAVNVSLNLGQVPPTPTTPKTFELGKIADDNAIDATEFGAGITVTGSTNMSKADILKLKPVLHVGGKAVSWDAFSDLTVTNDTWSIKLKPTDLKALHDAKQLVENADNPFDVVFGDGDLDPKVVNVSLDLGQVPPTPTTPKTFELGKIADDNAIDATEFGAGITVTGSTNMSKADILKLKPVLHVGGKAVSWDAFSDLTVTNDTWSINIKDTDLKALHDAKQLVENADNPFDVVFGEGDLDPKVVNVSLDLGQVPPTPTTPKTFELGKIADDNAIDATEFGAGITVTGSTNMSKADILKLKPVLHVGGKAVSWDAFSDLTVANDIWSIKLKPTDLQALKDAKQLVDKADNPFDVVFGEGDLDPKVVNVSLDLGQVPPTPSTPKTFELGKIAEDNAIDATEFGAGITVTGSTNMSKADILKLKPVLHVGGKEVSWDAFSDLTVTNDTWSINIKDTDLKALHDAKQLVDKADNEFDVVFGEGDLDPKPVNVSLNLGQMPPTPGNTFTISKVAGDDNTINSTEFESSIKIVGQSNLKAQEIKGKNPVLKIGGKIVEDAFDNVVDKGQGYWEITINSDKLKELEKDKHLLNKAETKFEVSIDDVEPSSMMVKLDLPTLIKNDNVFTIEHTSGVDNILDSFEFKGPGMRLSGFTNLDSIDGKDIKIAFGPNGENVFKEFGQDFFQGMELVVDPAKGTWHLVIQNAPNAVSGLLDDLVAKKWIEDKHTSDIRIEVKDVEGAAKSQVEADFSTSPSQTVDHKVSISFTSGFDNVINKAEYDGEGMIVRGASNVDKALADSSNTISVAGKTLVKDEHYTFSIDDEIGLYTFAINKAALDMLKNEGLLVEKANGGKSVDVVVGLGDATANAGVNLDTSGAPQVGKVEFFTISHTAGADDVYEPSTSDPDGLRIRGLTNLKSFAQDPKVKINGIDASSDTTFTLSNDGDGSWTCDVASTSDALKNLKAGGNSISIEYADGKVVKGEFIKNVIEIHFAGGSDNVIDANEWNADGVVMKGLSTFSDKTIAAQNIVVAAGDGKFTPANDMTVDSNGLWTLKLDASELKNIKDALGAPKGAITISITGTGMACEAGHEIEFADATQPVATTQQYIDLAHCAGMDDTLSWKEYGETGMLLRGTTNLDLATLKNYLVVIVNGEFVPAAELGDIWLENGIWGAKVATSTLDRLMNRFLLRVGDNDIKVMVNIPDPQPGDPDHVKSVVSTPTSQIPMLKLEPMALSIETTSNDDNCVSIAEVEKDGIVLRGTTAIPGSTFAGKSGKVVYNGVEVKVDDFGANIQVEHGTWKLVLDPDTLGKEAINKIKQSFAKGAFGKVEVQIDMAQLTELKAESQVEFLDDAASASYLRIIHTAGKDDVVDAEEYGQTGMVISGISSFDIEAMEIGDTDGKLALIVNGVALKAGDITRTYDGQTHEFTISIPAYKLKDGNGLSIFKQGENEVKMDIVNTGHFAISHVTQDSSQPQSSKKISFSSVAKDNIVDYGEFSANDIKVEGQCDAELIDKLKQGGFDEVTITGKNGTPTKLAVGAQDIAFGQDGTSWSFNIASDKLEEAGIDANGKFHLEASVGGVKGKTEFNVELAKVFTIDNMAGGDNVFGMVEFHGDGISMAGHTNLPMSSIKTLTISNGADAGKKRDFSAQDLQPYLKVDADNETWTIDIPKEKAWELFNEGVLANGDSSEVSIQVDGLSHPVESSLLTTGIDAPVFNVSNTAGDDNIIALYESEKGFVIKGSTNIDDIWSHVQSVAIGDNGILLSKDEIDVLPAPENGFWEIAVAKEKIDSLKASGILKEDVETKIAFNVDFLPSPVEAGVTLDSDSSSFEGETIKKYMRLVNSAGNNDIYSDLDMFGSGLVITGVTNMSADEIFGSDSPDAEFNINYSKTRYNQPTQTGSIAVKRSNFDLVDGVWKVALSRKEAKSMVGEWLDETCTSEFTIDIGGLEDSDKPKGAVSTRISDPYHSKVFRIGSISYDNVVDMTDMYPGHDRTNINISFDSTENLDSYGKLDHTYLVYLTKPGDTEMIGQAFVEDELSFSGSRSSEFKVTDFEKALGKKDGEYEVHLGLYKKENLPSDLKDFSPKLYKAILEDSRVIKFDFDGTQDEYAAFIVNTGNEDNVINGAEINRDGTIVKIASFSGPMIMPYNPFMMPGYQIFVEDHLLYTFEDRVEFGHRTRYFEASLPSSNLQDLVEAVGAGTKTMTFRNPDGKILASAPVDIRPDEAPIAMYSKPKLFLTHTAGDDNLVDSTELNEGFKMTGWAQNFDINSAVNQHYQHMSMYVGGRYVDDSFYKFTHTPDNKFTIEFAKENIEKLGLVEGEIADVYFDLGILENSAYGKSDIALKQANPEPLKQNPYYFNVLHMACEDDVVDGTEIGGEDGFFMTYSTNLPEFSSFNNDIKMTIGNETVRIKAGSYKAGDVHFANVNKFDFLHLVNVGIIKNGETAKFIIETPIGDREAFITYKPDLDKGTYVKIAHTGGADNVVDANEYATHGMSIWGSSNASISYNPWFELSIDGKLIAKDDVQLYGNQEEQSWGMNIDKDALEKYGIGQKNDMDVVVKYKDSDDNVVTDSAKVSIDLNLAPKPKKFNQISLDATAGDDDIIMPDEYDGGMVMKGHCSYDLKGLSDNGFNIAIGGKKLSQGQYELVVESNGDWKCTISRNVLDSLQNEGILKIGAQETVVLNFGDTPVQYGTVTRMTEESPHTAHTMTIMNSTLLDDVLDPIELDSGFTVIVRTDYLEDELPEKASLKIGDATLNDLFLHPFDPGLFSIDVPPEKLKELLDAKAISEDPKNPSTFSATVVLKDGTTVTCDYDKGLHIANKLPFSIVATANNDNLVETYELLDPNNTDGISVHLKRDEDSNVNVLTNMGYTNDPITISINGVELDSSDTYLDGRGGSMVVQIGIPALMKHYSEGHIEPGVDYEFKLEMGPSNRRHTFKSKIRFEDMEELPTTLEILNSAGVDNLADGKELSNGSNIVFKTSLLSKEIPGLKLKIDGQEVAIDPSKDIKPIKHSDQSFYHYWKIALSPEHLSELRTGGHLSIDKESDVEITVLKGNDKIVANGHMQLGESAKANYFTFDFTSGDDNIIDATEFGNGELVLRGRTNMSQAELAGKKKTLNVGGTDVDVSSSTIEVDAQTGIWTLRLPSGKLKELVDAKAIEQDVAKKMALEVEGVYPGSTNSPVREVTLAKGDVEFTMDHTSGPDNTLSLADLVGEGIVIGGRTSLSLDEIKALSPSIEIGGKVFDGTWVENNFVLGTNGVWKITIGPGDATSLLETGDLVNHQSNNVKLLLHKGTEVTELTRGLLPEIPEFIPVKLGDDQLLDLDEYENSGAILSGFTNVDGPVAGISFKLNVFVDGKQISSIDSSNLQINANDGTWSANIPKEDLQKLDKASKQGAVLSVKIGDIQERTMEFDIDLENHVAPAPAVTFEVASFAGGDSLVDVHELGSGLEIIGGTNQDLATLKAGTWKLTIDQEEIPVDVSTPGNLLLDVNGVWRLRIDTSDPKFQILSTGKELDASLEWTSGSQPPIKAEGKVTIAPTLQTITIVNTAGGDDEVDHVEYVNGFVVEGFTTMASADAFLGANYSLKFGAGNSPTIIPMSDASKLVLTGNHWQYKVDADQVASIGLDPHKNFKVFVIDGKGGAWAWDYIGLDNQTSFTLEHTASGDNVLKLDEYRQSGMVLSGFTNLSAKEIADGVNSINVGKQGSQISIVMEEAYLKVDGEKGTWSYTISGDKLDSLQLQDGENEISMSVGGLTADGVVTREQPTKPFAPQFSLVNTAGNDSFLGDKECASEGMALCGFTNMGKDAILANSFSITVNAGGKDHVIPIEENHLEVDANGVWSYRISPDLAKGFGMKDGDTATVRITFSQGSKIGDCEGALTWGGDSFNHGPRFEILATSGDDNLVQASEQAAGSLIRGVTNLTRQQIFDEGLTFELGGIVHTVRYDSNYFTVDAEKGVWSYMLTKEVIDSWKADTDFDAGKEVQLNVAVGDVAASSSTIALEIVPTSRKEFVLCNTAGNDNKLGSDELVGEGMILNGFTNLTNDEIKALKTVKITSISNFVELDSSLVKVDEHKGEWTLTLPKDKVSELNLHEGYESGLTIALGDGNLKGDGKVTLESGGAPANTDKFELTHVADGDDVVSWKEFKSLGMTLQGTTSLSQMAILQQGLKIDMGNISYRPNHNSLMVDEDNGLWSYTIPADDLKSMVGGGPIGNGQDVEVKVALGTNTPIIGKAHFDIEGDLIIMKTGDDDYTVSANEHDGKGMVMRGLTRLDAAQIANEGLVVRIGGMVVPGVDAKSIEVDQDGKWTIAIGKDKLDELAANRYVEGNDPAKVEIVVGETTVAKSTVTFDFPAASNTGGSGSAAASASASASVSAYASNVHNGGHGGIVVDGVEVMAQDGEMVNLGGGSMGRSVQVGDLGGAQNIGLALGDGNDVVNLFGANVSLGGGIQLGGGDDKLVVKGTVDAQINGGQGHDEVVFMGGGNVLNLSSFSGIEGIELNGASLGAPTGGQSNVINLDAKGLLANALGSDLVLSGSMGDIVNEAGLQRQSVETIAAEDSPLGKKSVRVTYDVDGESCRVVMNEDLYNGSFGII